MGSLISDCTRIYLVYALVRRCRLFFGQAIIMCFVSTNVDFMHICSLGHKQTAAVRRHLLKLEGALESGAGFRHETRGVDSTVPQVANFGQMGSMLLSLSPAKC